MTKNRKEPVSVFHIIQRELKEEKELRPNLDKYSFLKKRIAKLLKGTDYREKIKELDINLFKVIFDWNRIDEKNILYDNEMNNWLYYTGYNEETEEGSYKIVYDLIELAKMPFGKFAAPFIVDKKEDLPKGIEVQCLTPDEKGIAELYVTYLEFEDKGNDEPELDQLTNLFKVVSPDYYKHPGELEASLNKDEEYYLKRGCTETQLAYIKLFHLTKKYIKQNPKTTDGKKMSINKAVIIVYSDNKEIFPNWADSSLNSYYYKGENLTINI